MAKIYFVCGFIGSGKTTYAKMLETEKNAFRFSPDEWMIPLFGEHLQRDVFDSRLSALKTLFKSSAIQMIRVGVSVIFDFGFWRKSERIEIAAWAKEHNLEFELIYLDVDFEECKKRALQRNQNCGKNAYQMTPEMLDLFWSWFEEPSADEDLILINS